MNVTRELVPGESAGLLVVVPCLNEAAHIGGLLRFLRSEIDAIGGPARIVVADGGSTDGTPAIAATVAESDPRVSVLDNPKRLQSAGINAAVAAHGDGARFLIRVDAHGDYPEGFLSTLIEEADATGAASVVVSMVTEGAEPFASAAAAAQNSVLGNGGSSHRRAAAGRFVEHGHHALMRISAFRAVGGYDETFSHNEDAELDYRLAMAGHRIWLTGRTQIRYYPRRTPAALFRQYYNYGRGRARTLVKHRTRPKIRQLTMVMVAPTVALAALGIVFPPAIVPALVWALACVVYGFLLGFREKSVAAAGSGFAAMIMHLSWSLGFWRTWTLGR
jgi:succinoglycan biosynthesis protein ExoA